MISVHLVGGPYASFLPASSFAPFFEFWILYLARASVAALSFISGYLMAELLDRSQFTRLTLGRARVLLIPMAVWNLVTIAAILVAHSAGFSFVADRVDGLDTPMKLLNAVTGLNGPTIDLSLFFLRDLFVSGALIALCWPAIRRTPLIAVGVVLVLTTFDLTAPIVFRPAILLFLLIGCVARDNGIRLSRMVRPDVVVVTLAGWAVVYFLLPWLVDGIGLTMGKDSLPIRNLKDVTKRAGLVVAVLCIGYYIGRGKLRPLFDPLAPVAYLSYLSHGIVVKLIWWIMAFAGIRLATPSYLLYFFMAPLLVFLLALLALPLIDRLPPPLPALIKGKPGVPLRGSQKAA